MKVNLSKIFELTFVLIFCVTEIDCTLTPRNIESHNYPVQKHLVHTSDGYLLTIFRIPPHTQSHEHSNKTNKVVLLQHGFTLSSDVWLLRGPESDLPYLLADEGYDVWLGNNRGNPYSRRHITLDPQADKQYFWNFTWHEMGYYDLPSMIDYILADTGQESLHYVGYSQGGLVALVLLTTRPEYGAKFKTLQFTAPTVYMKHIQVPIISNWRYTLGGYLGRIFDWWGYAETLTFGRSNIYQRACKALCGDGAYFRPLYLKVYGMLAGRVNVGENYQRILPDMCATLPLGASNKQLLHYIQLHAFDGFNHFDYGSPEKNLRQYGHTTPPSYNLSAVNNCITLYYSETDNMSAAEDVRQLGKELHCAELYLLPHKAWNHGDFVWSRHVRQSLHDPIIKKINVWEADRIGGCT
ncbi:lipase 3-like isoform X1 [Eurosta solidaginis]|uniref:lipase 3-like isoform X1 n=1 Tax=Eurosta solidaginis TaxID=178769 RepID=UPI00353089A6